MTWAAEEAASVPIVAVAAQPGAQDTNYFHFVANTLPALLRLHATGALRVANEVYVRARGAFAPELVRLAGMDILDKARHADRSLRVSAGQVLLPRAASLVPDALDVEMLRAGFKHVAPLALSPADATLQRLVVYMHRGPKGDRSVSNWVDVVDLLRIRYGQDRVMVHGAEIPVSKALSMAKAASLMVGPMGSGLANAIWMSPSAAVVEIAAFVNRPSQRLYTLYPEISAAAGLRHFMYLVPTNRSVFSVRDLHVDLGAMVRPLDRVDGAHELGQREL